MLRFCCTFNRTFKGVTGSNRRQPCKQIQKLSTDNNLFKNLQTSRTTENESAGSPGGESKYDSAGSRTDESK